MASIAYSTVVIAIQGIKNEPIEGRVSGSLFHEELAAYFGTIALHEAIIAK
jgi:hypothetical protein